MFWPRQLYYSRYLINKDIRRFQPNLANQPVVTLQDLDEEMAEYQSVYDEMQQTIREHKDFGAAGGIYQSFKICSIQKVKNPRLWIRYERRYVNDFNRRSII